ncbi:large conductance mechanosensitive channel protein MscL [Nocardioides bruguierae]|uniref:MscL family protein n=1 Tax=Nocardioides bruguierae TaxID=2945102 RepID=A0A9X2IFX2_9ACTN|nr:MscL family protein [Nocardioides bruguierae]MCL8026845.1 MscL family protein [Nocardioides bruguierae]MCM0621443.1 MscL family protein [Nocardioides bruguierae]
MLSGFKNFLLRGNLVDLAVAVIIGTAFATVVTAFTALLLAQIPDADEVFVGAEEGSVGYFLNALIAFLVMAAVVYFFVVLPYTKAKEKWFPSAPPGTPEDTVLLREIRDLLQSQAAAENAPAEGGEHKA